MGLWPEDLGLEGVWLLLFVGGGFSFPMGPSSPGLWFLVPIKAPKSFNSEYLDLKP